MTTLEHIAPPAAELPLRSAAQPPLRFSDAPVVTQAVIMAGGKGTRLYPYSALLPKPLMPLGDMPILELLLRQMRQAGISDVLVAVNHLRHLEFFGDAENTDHRGQVVRFALRRTNGDGPH